MATQTYAGPAILIVGETTTDLTATISADGGRWWADLSAPAACDDSACRLILPSGDVGRGRIAAGSTVMQGDGEAPRLGWR